MIRSFCFLSGFRSAAGKADHIPVISRGHKVCLFRVGFQKPVDDKAAQALDRKIGIREVEQFSRIAFYDEDRIGRKEQRKLEWK
jgi:hypothetical protein